MWLDNPTDEEQKGNQNPLNSPSVGAGGGAAAPSGTSSNPSTLNPVQSNQAPQEFATVQDYLGANKQQGEDLGQKFTTGLSQNITDEKSAIDSAAGQTQQDITAGTTPFDSALTAKATSNPTEVANNPDQLGSYLKQWNASYSGPSSFEASKNYGTAAGALTDAQTKQAETATAGGQQQLLQDNFGVYGQGNKGLDQAILQNSSAFPAVQDLSKQFGTVQDYLGQKAGTVNTQATKAAADTAATKQQTQDALQGNVTNFKSGLDAKTAAAQKAATDVMAKYKSDLASADPAKVQADLKASGVDDATTKNITDYLTALNKNYGINPNISDAYIGNPTVDISNANVATPEDYARAAAYGKLSGVDYSGVLNPADISKAGTGTLQQNAFKSNDLQGYLKDQLTMQDKSRLSSDAPKLNTLLPDVTNIDQGSKIAQDYIDAANRQGVKATNGILPPVLQGLANQAITVALPARMAAMKNLTEQRIYMNSPGMTPEKYEGLISASPQVQTVAGANALLQKLSQWSQSK